MRDGYDQDPPPSGEGDPSRDASIAARRRVMRILANALPEEIHAALASLSPLPPHSELRKAEVGLVMVRGRIGGDGAPFNVGEATVTRAVVRLETGEVGFCYLLGRDPARARAAALLDAIWQSPAGRDRIEKDVIPPLVSAASRRAAVAAGRTNATRVEFFTMVRGEDL